MSTMSDPFRTNGYNPIIVDGTDGLVSFFFDGNELHQRLCIETPDGSRNLNDFHRTLLVQYDPSSTSTIRVQVNGTVKVSGLDDARQVAAFGVFRCDADDPYPQPLANVAFGNTGADRTIAVVDVSGGIPWVTIAFTAVVRSADPSGMPTFLGDPLVILVPKRD